MASSSRAPGADKRAPRKDQRASLRGRSVLVLVVLIAAVALAMTRPVQLGLDLRGGTQIVFQATPTPGTDLASDTLDRTVEVLRRRVDQLGVSEPTLQSSGTDRIIVELPGVTDPEQALETIGQTAQLTFHPVLAVGLPEDQEVTRVPSEATDELPLALEDEDGQTVVLGPTALTGESVVSAVPQIGTGGGTQYSVGVAFEGAGATAWQQLTAEAACQPVGDPTRRAAIVLDQEVISSPQVAPEVACGQGLTDTTISGQFDEAGATELALLIEAGALPVPIEVIEQRTIGPTLGQDAISSSIVAALVGVLLTILYLTAAYRVFGLIAGLALITYGLLSYAALGALGAVLTLPGIAGFVLAIGMAVDANVLVFERAKEERAEGKTVRAATRTGFQKALTAVVDSNVTTIIAALLLFFFASGAVRGYGITLTIGVLVSMFSALVLTRVLIEWLVQSKRFGTTGADKLGLSAWRRIAEWIDEHQPDLMGRSRIWLSVAAAAIVLSFTGIAVQGVQFGLEFTGGQLLEYRTEQAVDPDELRAALDDQGLPRAVVQSSGDEQVSIRTTELTSEQQTAAVEAITELGGDAEVIREEFIGPTIGDELTRNALIALGLALLGQLIYLAIRFRWTYGTASVLALFHDAMIVIGTFVWLGLEFDGVFLAALLTVIGYSINDSVVIFDRVRERRGLEPDRDLAAVTNEACLQTLPRTINTGIGAWFILLALLIFGGDTLSEFAFALLLGTFVGTYSSILIGSPLFLLFERLRARFGRPDEEEDERKKRKGTRITRTDGARV